MVFTVKFESKTDNFNSKNFTKNWTLIVLIGNRWLIQLK